METFETRAVRLTDDLSEQLEVLTAQGKKGWRLAAVLKDEVSAVAYLQRPEGAIFSGRRSQ